MADEEHQDVQNEQQNDQLKQAQTPKKRNILRNILMSLLLVIILLIAALAVMFSTDKGSKFLLDRVASSQKIIDYQYESGNLLQGIILKNVLVTLAAVDVKIDRADVSLGWRAILDKEIHLSHADVNNLRIISKTPPSDEPFKFSEIKLPFVLRLDEANVDHMQLQTASTKIDFNDIHLENALWSGTELKFENSKMDMAMFSSSTEEIHSPPDLIKSLARSLNSR